MYKFWLLAKLNPACYDNKPNNQPLAIALVLQSVRARGDSTWHWKTDYKPVKISHQANISLVSEVKTQSPNFLAFPSELY